MGELCGWCAARSGHNYTLNWDYEGAECVCIYVYNILARAHNRKHNTKRRRSRGWMQGQVIITGEIWRDRVFVRITRTETGDGSRILRNALDLIRFDVLHLYDIYTLVVVIFHPDMSSTWIRSCVGVVVTWSLIYYSIQGSNVLRGSPLVGGWMECCERI